MSETIAPAVTEAAPVEAPAPLTSMVDTPAAETPAETPPPEVVETPEAKATREAAEADTRAADSLKALEADTMPEGVTADPTVFADFKAAAAKHGLSPEAAQALVDSVAPKLSAAMAEPIRVWKETQEAWKGAITADKEYSGNVEQAAGICRRGIDALMGADGPKAIEALAYTGAGNNPHIFKMLHRVGKMVGEGTPVGGRAAGERGKLGAAALYPSLAGSA